MQNQLTLIITTYNREQSLKKQLRSIFDQSQSKEIPIIILDNCSDYDLPSMLVEYFSEKERSSIQLIQHKFNTELCFNIVSAFLNCRTEWMWLLSDDDLTAPHSLEKIHTYIAKYPDCACFKFISIGQHTTVSHSENKVVSLADFIQYTRCSEMNLGNFIFMSNNVFNLSQLAPYIPVAFKYSYTYFPHILPLIAGLSEKKIWVNFIDDKIVTYQFPDAPSNTNRLVDIYAGTYTFSDIHFDITAKERKALMNFFRMNTLYNSLYFYLTSQHPFKSDFYKKTYLFYSSGGWNLRDYCTYLFFIWQEKFGVNLLFTLKKIYDKIYNKLYKAFF